LTMATRLFNSLTKWGFGLSVAAGVANEVIYDVDGGQCAVIFDKGFGGVKQDVIGEGTHFKIPIIQEPVIYNIRVQPRVFENSTQSKDLQVVSIATRVLYRPMVEKLPQIYNELGGPDEYDDRVLKSIAEEVIKSVVAEYDAEQLITMRQVIADKVFDNMRTRAEIFNIEFDDVSLVDIQFGADFRNSVEMKQVAFQEAEEAKFKVEEAEQMKKAKIIRAQGEAQAADLLNKSIEDVGQGIIELRKIEAAKEIAATMSRSRNVAYLPGGQGQPMLLNMNVGGQ